MPELPEIEGFMDYYKNTGLDGAPIDTQPNTRPNYPSIRPQEGVHSDCKYVLFHSL